VQMPEMDGYEATRVIRGLERSGDAHVPIIATTAHAMSEHRQQCLDAGMDDHIAKPLRKRELWAIVERWLRHDGATVSGLSSARAASPSAKMQEQAEAMDYAAALAEFDDDIPFFQDVLQGFLENSQKQVATMRAALERGDAETLRREAHSMKGGAANLTAMNLSRAAAAVENCGRGQQLEHAADLLDDLEQELLRLQVQARGIVNT